MDSVRRIFGALLGDIERESEAVKQDSASHLAATIVSVSNSRAQKRFCLRPATVCRLGHIHIKRTHHSGCVAHWGREALPAFSGAIPLSPLAGATWAAWCLTAPRMLVCARERSKTVFLLLWHPMWICIIVCSKP